jgi:hypothetical protein
MPRAMEPERRAMPMMHLPLLSAATGKDLAKWLNPKTTPSAFLGRWLGRRKYVAFFADGSWGVQRSEATPIEFNGRRWRIEGNRLFLSWRGEGGLQTTERIITSFMTKRFVTEGDGYNETYDWAP